MSESPFSGEPNKQQSAGSSKKKQNVKEEHSSQGKGTLKQQRQSVQPNKSMQGTPPAEGTTPKTKAQLRAERRAIQEAQRAAKAKQTPTAPVLTPRMPRRVGLNMSGCEDDKRVLNFDGTPQSSDVSPRRPYHRKIGFFAHLPQYKLDESLTKDAKPGVHPVILKLGVQYAEGILRGSNARCIALLGALKQVIESYITPRHQELSRDLAKHVQKNMDFLAKYRPLSVSMIQAVKHLKSYISTLPRNLTEDQAKQSLYDCIDNYKQDICLAGDAIAKNLIENDKITDGDTIMVYAFSSLIRNVLYKAHDEGKTFSVVVVDGRPMLEGREMLRCLVKHGIRCSYILISAVSYVMREVTKVLLGAHALLANGYVMSRVGSSQVALIARSYNVPVLVCCETYKFSEKVQTDSFVRNELGDPNSLIETGKKDVCLNNWKDQKGLHLLNFIYDVTPSDLISMVITELGMVPCTSVPVVLRIKQN